MANLNISVVEKRIFTLAEAASYTGLPTKHFKASCPVRPVEMRPGTVHWDKRDLDQWIDAMKEGAEMATQDAILGKL
jgi:predicted alpha/beta hydrolase family esterase